MRALAIILLSTATAAAANCPGREVYPDAPQIRATKQCETFVSETSAWIEAGEWCEGFFILRIRPTDKEYVHVGMPREVFDGFKSAQSQGSYYQRHIRGRFCAP